MRTTLVCLCLLPGSLALASPEGGPTDVGVNRALPARGDLAVGARIGGWGFRRDTETKPGSWDRCRMNGLGVFGEYALGPKLYVEAALDTYFTDRFPMGGAADEDLPIERTSVLATAAIGVRVPLGWRLTGAAQLGAGVEATWVKVPYDGGQLRDRQTAPMGFFGFGGDLRIGARTALGMSLRVNAMSDFSYDPDQLEMQDGWTTPPVADEIFAPQVGFAAQGQFTLRHAL